MFIEIFVTLAIVYISIWMLKRKILMVKLQAKFPSPKGHPLIGHSITFMNPDTMIENFRQIHKDLGKTIFIQLGFDYYLDTIDPKFAEFISSNSIFNTKSYDYIFLHNWFGTGLLTASGDKWRSHRKVLTPSFHYTILEEFVKVFNDSGTVLINKLKQIEDKENVDIYDYVTLLTLDIIHETAMGTSINAQTNPNSLYVQAIRDMCDVIYQRIFSPVGRFRPLYNISSIRRKEKKALKIIHEHSFSVIERRRKLLNEEKEGNNEDEIGAKKKNTFLDVLLKSTINEKSLTNEDIREEVDTFMFEGHDTTAVAISFILFCIANHQDIQAKVFIELKSIFGDDKDRPVTYREMHDMKYLEMVIREGLRMYPSVPSYGRMLTDDIMYGKKWINPLNIINVEVVEDFEVSLEVTEGTFTLSLEISINIFLYCSLDGVLLPKGIMVSISPIIMHMDPELYPDPEIFDPNRFSLENSSTRHPYAYLPFSAGSRNCIGQKFAMLEMKSSISKILRNFKLLPARDGHNLKLGSKVTLYSKNGIKLKLLSR